MKIQKILQSGFFNIAQISRQIGLSHPSMLHQKLSKKKGNKLTDQNLSDIKNLLENLINDNEVLNLTELFHIFECIFSGAISEEEIIVKIEKYQDKYADIGLIDFYDAMQE